MPRGGQRARFRFAVAHYAYRDQVGIVEHRSKRVREGIAEFAAFVDRPGRFGGGVARNAAGKRKLFEQLAQALLIAGNVRVYLGIGPLQVGVGHHRRSAVPRAADGYAVQAALLDDTVHMGIDQVQAGTGPPVSQQPRLDVFRGQRGPEQGVVHEIDLSDGQVVCRPPIGVDHLELPFGYCLTHFSFLPFAGFAAKRQHPVIREQTEPSGPSLSDPSQSC